MPTRSEQRRINVQLGKSVNEGLEPEYIERETVVAFLENMAASRYLIQCFENQEKFPAADVVEVRHGEWIELVRDLGKGRTITKYQCSLCGVYLVMEANYCPHCGAKMDGKAVRSDG